MVARMKTTIELPDELVAEVKRLAATDGVTMRDLMLDGLRSEIERRSSPRPRPDFAFPTFRGDGLVSDVEPSHWRELAHGLPLEGPA